MLYYWTIFFYEIASFLEAYTMFLTHLLSRLNSGVGIQDVIHMTEDLKEWMKKRWNMTRES